MTIIVNFQNYKQKKQELEQAVKHNPADVEALLTVVADQVISDWSRHVEVDKLNQYFAEVLDVPDDDYMEDLNLLAEIENDIGLRVVIFSPGTHMDIADGWVAGFYFDDIPVNTPPMTHETYARAFSILLYYEMLTWQDTHR